MTRCGKIAGLLLACCGVGCDGTELAQSPLSVCKFPSESGMPAVLDGRPSLRVLYARNDTDGLRMAAAVTTALEQMTGVPFGAVEVTATSDPRDLRCQGPGCPRSSVAVGQLALDVDDSPPQGDTVRTHSFFIDGHRLYLIQGQGKLNAQIAVFRFLQALGVRYLHPRATYYPHRPRLAIPPAAERTEAPHFRRRGWRLETDVPTPTAEAFLDPGASGFTRATEVIDWLAANGRTAVLWRIDQSAPRDHTRSIGSFAKSRGLAFGLELPFGETSFDAVRMAEILDLGVDLLVVDVDDADSGPSAISSVLDEMARIGEYAGQASLPVKVAMSFGPRFLRSAQEAQVDLARLPRHIAFHVRVPLFYNLFSVAPLYGGSDLRAALAVLVRNADLRDVVYVPQVSSWRPADLTVPIFAPAYWYSRWVDFNRLLSYPKVDISMSGAGWEWGYWSNAAVAFEASWAPQLSYEAVIERVFSSLGRNTCDQFVDVLGAMAAEQYRLFVEEGLATNVVGHEPSARLRSLLTPPELPLPIAYADLLTMDAAKLAAFVEQTFAPLRAHLDGWIELERRLFPAIPRVDPSARPFVQEVLDAASLTRLRLAHRLALLRAVLAARAGDLETAEENLAAAADQSNLARIIVGVREAQYRYPAADVAHVRQTVTEYPYGYLYPANQLAYWVSDEELVARLVRRH